MGSHCPCNSCIFKRVGKVLARQLPTDSRSTPLGTGASIKIMRPSFNLSANCKTMPGPVRPQGRFCHRTPIAPRAARRSERGAGHFKAIVWLLAFASFIYVMVRVVPVLVADFQFQDGVQTIARFASATRQTPEQIRAAVLKEAQKDDVPIDAKDVKIEAVSGNVRIHVDYSVVVDLMVYQWTLNFHPSASNDSLT